MNSVDIAGQASKVEKADLMCDSGAEKKSLLNVILRSYVVWALLALVAANLLFQELPFDRYASANRSMVWWAVDDFRRQKKCPDVVLIGSSLLMHVQYFGNADYLKLPQNEVYHHKSVMLEDLLRRRTGVKVDSFAFAIGGTMASDAYALASTLFSQKRKPKVVIYGIAPRDFIDNILCSPASTETFRLMSRLDGVKDVEWAERDGFWEKVEYLFESASSLYKHRNYFVHLQQHYVKLLLRLDGYKITDEVHIPFALRVLSCRDMPEDIGSNEKIILPNIPIRWLDNRSEYRRRYQPFNASAFMNQCRYLERFLSFCRRQGIEVILVNMPLTEDNLKLLTPGAYDLYKQSVSRLASKYQGQFIDMQDTKRFDKSLYCDSAHMNGAGGIKFFQELADRLTDGSHLAMGKNVTWQ